MLAKSLPCALLLSAACGTVTVHEGPDAMAEADAEVEPTPDAVPEPCDLTMPFGEAVRLDALSGADHDSFASLSPDELTIYFASNRAAPGTPGVDLFVATRANLEAPFGAPVALAVVNTPSYDGAPSISADGLELYFHSTRSGTPEIYVSTRPTTAAPFTTPVVLGPDVNTAATEASPAIAADGSALYFDREDGAGVAHLWRATRGPTGFGAAIEVTAVSTPDGHWSSPSNDELTIYFSSARPGGQGVQDIWVATRATAAESFGPPTVVTELNTAGPEGLDWVSPDGCRAYISARRSVTTDFDLYVASRPR